MNVAICRTRRKILFIKLRMEYFSLGHGSLCDEWRHWDWLVLIPVPGRENGQPPQVRILPIISAA
jgi:hypothetical protein